MLLAWVETGDQNCLLSYEEEGQLLVEIAEALEEATREERALSDRDRLIDIIREVAPDRLEDKIWQDWKAEALALRAENAAMKEYIEYTKDLRRNI